MLLDLAVTLILIFAAGKIIRFHLDVMSILCLSCASIFVGSIVLQPLIAGALSVATVLSVNRAIALAFQTKSVS